MREGAAFLMSAGQRAVHTSSHRQVPLHGVAAGPVPTPPC